MAENSAIEWTDHTHNEWLGCTGISPGCDHCYAEATMDKRLHVVRWGVGEPRKRTSIHNRSLPFAWQRHARAFFEAHGRRQRVFSASLSDWLDNKVEVEWLVDLLDTVRQTPDLDWLMLSKRIGNWKKRLGYAHAIAAHQERVELAGWIAAWTDGAPPPHVWVGATVVNQEEADRDIPKLLATPARVRFLSMEPLLGPVDIRWTFSDAGVIRCPRCGFSTNRLAHGPCPNDGATLGNDVGVDWVIAGGESSPGARPSHPDWFRSLRDQCAAAGVPFLFKQWGEWSPGYAEHGNDLGYETIVEAKQHEWPEGHCAFRVGRKAAGRLLDGVTHNGFPA